MQLSSFLDKQGEMAQQECWKCKKMFPYRSKAQTLCNTCLDKSSIKQLAEEIYELLHSDKT